MTTRGTRHGDWIPGRCLEVNIGGVIGDFRSSSAHDTSERLDAVVVTDDNVFGEEFAVDVVEGLELLPCLGIADN